jgi:sporulation protein YlmC with PRC-barrel domain
MRLKQLHGLPVIDPTTARKIGIVVDYQIDPASGRLAALDVGGNDESDRDGERILAQRIRRVGRSAVILTGTGRGGPRIPRTIDDRWLDESTLVGLEVMGDDGDGIGRLVDATFDQDSLGIAFYVLRSSIWNRLLGRRSRIVPGVIHSSSRELMIVSTGRLRELPAAAAAEAPSPALPMALKTDDRLLPPNFEPVPDGQAAAAHSS